MKNLTLFLIFLGILFICVNYVQCSFKDIDLPKINLPNIDLPTVRVDWKDEKDSKKSNDSNDSNNSNGSNDDEIDSDTNTYSIENGNILDKSSNQSKQSNSTNTTPDVKLLKKYLETSDCNEKFATMGPYVDMGNNMSFGNNNVTNNGLLLVPDFEPINNDSQPIDVNYYKSKGIINPIYARKYADDIAYGLNRDM